MDPVKPQGTQVLNDLTVHPSGIAELLGMEQEQQGEIFHLGGGKVHSFHLLLHCITLI